MDISNFELVLVLAVIVLLVAVLVESQRLSTLKARVARIERALRSQVSLGQFGLSPDVEQEVRRLVDSGKKIPAIKLVREHTGLPLREAKELVDRF